MLRVVQGPSDISSVGIINTMFVSVMRARQMGILKGFISAQRVCCILTYIRLLGVSRPQSRA